MTFKQRNTYLFIGAILFGVLSYFFAFKKTFELANNVSIINNEIQNASSAPERIRMLQKNLQTLDSKMQRYLFDSTHHQEFIMGLVTRFCSVNKLILKEFPQLSVKEETDIFLETTTITVQGAFIDLCKLIYYFEQKAKIGRISSVRYEAGMDYKTRKKTLTATIFLQNIRKKS